MKIKHLIAAAALALVGGTAHSSPVQLVQGPTSLTIPLTATTPPGQDFVTQLQNANATTLYTGPLQLLLAGGDYNLTFSLVGAESKFNNTLSFNGNPIITETYVNSALPDFTTGALGGLSFSTNISGGVDLASMLLFSNPQGGNFPSSTVGFGVFADAASIGHLTTFYLALDDGGAIDPITGLPDDNHDDIIVRVDVAPIPLPAAGWMLLAGLGGLVGMRRFRKTT